MFLPTVTICGSNDACDVHATVSLSRYGGHKYHPTNRCGDKFLLILSVLCDYLHFQKKLRANKHVQFWILCPFIIKVQSEKWISAAPKLQWIIMEYLYLKLTMRYRLLKWMNKQSSVKGTVHIIARVCNLFIFFVALEELLTAVWHADVGKQLYN